MHPTDVITDLVIATSRHEEPDDKLLKRSATAIDTVVISPVEFLRYDNRLTRTRVQWRRIHNGEVGPVPLEVLDGSALEELAALPLSRRAVEELRRLRIDRIALNPVALAELRDEVMEKMPRGWVDWMVEHGEQLYRRDGFRPPKPTDLVAKLGIELVAADSADSVDVFATNFGTLGSALFACIGDERGAAQELDVSALQLRMEQQIRTLGQDHPDTLRSMCSLAEVLRLRGELDRAESLLRQVLSGFQRVLGPEQPDTLITTLRVAALIRTRGDSSESEALREHALEVSRRVLGPDHPVTRAAATPSDASGKVAGGEHFEARSHRFVPGFPKQFLASDKVLKWTTPLPKGFPEVLLLEITTKGKELVVRTGGFGFVEEGCELTVTWLDLLENQNADPVTIRDEDAPIRFVGNEQYDAGQYLVVEFRRSGEASYAVKAKLEI